LDAELERGRPLLTAETNHERAVTGSHTARRRSRTSPEQSVEEGGEEFINKAAWWANVEDPRLAAYYAAEDDKESMLPKHMPCFMSPRHATMAVASGGIVSKSSHQKLT
jgi:hypothetical protein